MKIKRLWVSQNRCLNNFEIEFDTSDFGTSTILIGANGTGKTTLIETVLEIVCSFDTLGNEMEPKYDYDFEYEFRRCNILITKRKQNYELMVEGVLFSNGDLKKIKDDIQTQKVAIFPQRVMALYSGRNKKIRQFCDSSDGFALFSINYIHHFFHNDLEDVELFRKSNQMVMKSKYNYFSDDIVPILLISILGSPYSKAKKYLLELCNFRSINSVRIQVDLKHLKDFKDKTNKQASLMDIFYILVDVFDNNFTDLLKNSLSSLMLDTALFHIKNIQQFNFDTVGLFNFFALLKKYFKAQIDVTVYYGTTNISYNDISEGQMQLIKILGMMGICKDEDCLVLIDEPDAHMNPNWKQKIYYIIEDLLKDASFTHALIATHEPLVINGVEKEKIRIFYKKELYDDGAISYTADVIQPNEDIIGLGIDGILQSEYFGLESVLDANTKEKMEYKYSLLLKKKNGTITNIETEKLKLVTNELENMIFARNIPTDIYYDEYVAAMHKIYNECINAPLIASDISERNRKAEEILRGLLEI